MTMLKERVETLERELDERATISAYARCYGVLTAVLTVLMVIPITKSRRELIAWSLPTSSSDVAMWMTIVLLFMVPLLFLLVCATIRPGKSPWLGWWIAGFAAIDFVFLLILLSDSGLTVAPAGYVLVVVLFLTALLGCVHAVHRTRAVRERMDPLALG